MKQIFVDSNQAGQRLDKMLLKYFKNAPKSFIYKMLRKKNITRNGKKADGSELLRIGDEIKLFLSEETICAFTGTQQVVRTVHPRIVYEDSSILVLNKPAGVLSQKAAAGDVSLVEQVISYLLDTEQITEETLKTFRPSVCNRLDRNTTGLVAAGKTLPALQTLSALFRDRQIQKYYRCVVKGKLESPGQIKGYLTKDEKTNKVTVSSSLLEDDKNPEDRRPVETEYTPIAATPSYTLLEIHLLTGKTHQIRAHLASMGHPIVGDHKYGDPETNEYFFRNYGLKYQLLHSCRLEFPLQTGVLAQCSGKVITAKEPRLFREICTREGLI